MVPKSYDARYDGQGTDGTESPQVLQKSFTCSTKKPANSVGHEEGYYASNVTIRRQLHVGAATDATNVGR